MKGLHGLLLGLSVGMMFSVFYSPIFMLMDEDTILKESLKIRAYTESSTPSTKSIKTVTITTTTSDQTATSTEATNKTNYVFINSSSSVDTFMDQNNFVKIMEALQAERKMVMKKACEKVHPSKMENCAQGPHSSTLGKFIPSNVFYSNTYKYAVCYIQKCGYTSWLNAIQVHDGLHTFAEVKKGKSLRKEDIGFVMKNRAISAISNTSLKEMTWNKSLKIIRVRNPFERIVSAYNDKMTEKYGPFTYVYGPMSKQINKNYKPLRHNLEDRLKNDTTASFEDFVRHLLSDAPRDSHWEFYDSFCRPCYAGYDYVIKFETIAQDLAYLKLKLNITNKDHEKVFTARNTRTKLDTTKKYFDQIPKELAERLYTRYKIDFLIFGYEKPSWLCSDTT